MYQRLECINYAALISTRLNLEQNKLNIYKVLCGRIASEEDQNQNSDSMFEFLEFEVIKRNSGKLWNPKIVVRNPLL